MVEKVVKKVDNFTVITKNGFQQDRKSKVPRNIGLKMISINLDGPGCSINNSTDKETSEAVGGEEIHVIEMACCPLQ